MLSPSEWFRRKTKKYRKTKIMTAQQKQAILQICDAVVEGIKVAGPIGIPSGHVYASLMHFGCNLSQYESLIGILVKAGKIRKQGDLLFAI
jgi:hypothetical protein